MNAKELRIGNLIKNGAGNVITVSSETIVDVILKHISAQPIELTMYWMEKLGMDNLNNVSARKGDLIIEDSDGLWDCSWNPERATYLRGIEYVHELQNLYFALTGYELEQA